MKVPSIITTTRGLEQKNRKFFPLLLWLCGLAYFFPIQGNAQELFVGQMDFSPKEVDRIYLRGLQYLVRTQTAEGTWTDSQYGSQPAVVGLAVVSMLAHGDEPNFGPYSVAIRRGLNFILKQQNPKTGYIGTSMYNHGFATLALAECYGAVEDPRIGSALQKAVQLIIGSQKNNPFHAWRYSPESVDADSTVTGAQLVALFAARNAGVAVPEESIKQGVDFLLSLQVPDGGFGYTSKDAPNGTRTAIACLILKLAGEKDSKEFKAGFDFFVKAPPENAYLQYYLYYGSQAAFQGSQAEWQKWNQKNIKLLTQTQTREGSWDGQIGSSFSTAASLLSLALNYRYLPIYER